MVDVRQQNIASAIKALLLDDGGIDKIVVHLGGSNIFEAIGYRCSELSVEAEYIGGESHPKLQCRKAGMYLAYLWRSLPKKYKAYIPEGTREEWSSVARSYGRFVPSKQKHWGPKWFDMFRDCEFEDLYREDYAFLSAIAHGSYEEQALRYSRSRVPMHDHHKMRILVIYASRYLAFIGKHWNDRFNLIDTDELEDLLVRLDGDVWERPQRRRNA